MGAIVDIQLGRLQGLLDERKITLTLDDAAREWLAGAGYDPAFGARPLKRVIQKAVQDPLADRILAGTIPDGTALTLSADAEGLILFGDSLMAREAVQLGGGAPPSDLGPASADEGTLLN